MEGLNHTEIRHLAEKIGEQPEHQVDSEKLAEFSVPSWLVRERGRLALAPQKINLLTYEMLLCLSVYHCTTNDLFFL